MLLTLIWCMEMSIQLYIIRQSLTKQVHQSIKAIFLAIYVAIPKNDNEVVLIAAKYPKVTPTHAI